MAGLILSLPLRRAYQAGLDHYLAAGEGPVPGQHLELTAVRAGGSELPVELSITKVAPPGPPVFTACLRDLTGRNQASYDLARLRRNGLITRRAHANTYDLTPRRPQVRDLLHQSP